MRRWLLDKTQSAATIFAVAKSTCAKKRISVNRFCSPDVSAPQGFVIFIVDSIHRESARASGRECSDEDFALPASWEFVISRQIFALRRQSHERLVSEQVIA
jgi:hypothetical protein